MIVHWIPVLGDWHEPTSRQRDSSRDLDLHDYLRLHICSLWHLGIGKHHSADLEARMVQESDLDWGDFFFNFVSMVIVYAYFSKVAAKGETCLAILLCIGVASLDVVLLLMRWLWFEQYMHYGWVKVEATRLGLAWAKFHSSNLMQSEFLLLASFIAVLLFALPRAHEKCLSGRLVLHIFQVYRVLVVPVANTWMSWRVLQNMNFQAELHIIVLLAVLFMLCMVLGIQVIFSRFFILTLLIPSRTVN